MPSPRPPGLSLRSFPTRRPAKRNAAAIPKKAKTLIELMLWGVDSSGPLGLREAAKAMNIAESTAARYLAHPRARAFYMDAIRQMRTGEMAKNTRTLIEIRDDPSLSTAAGAKAKIESIRTLEGTDDRIRSEPSALGGNAMPGIVVHVSFDRPPAQVSDEIIEISANPGDPT